MDRSAFTLKIRKRSLTQFLALYIFIAPLLLNFLMGFLFVPSLVKYTVDLAWVIALVSMLFARRQYIYKKTLPVFLFLAVYVLYITVVYLFEFQSVYYFLWGIRNNFRYYFAFFIFVYLLDKNDVKFCLKFIDVLFVIHIIVSFIQFFFFGYKWDYLGGIFGVELGCNGHSLILLVVACTRTLLRYMYGAERLLPALAKCSAALVIATLAELKFFFVLFLMILVISALITQFSWKKIFLITGVGGAAFLTGNLFTSIWGTDAALTYERILSLIQATNYSSEKDLGRISAIPTISNTFLTNLPDKLFGLGLGNCDTSSFSICNTPFYQAHSHLNYDWFSSAFTFLETGYVGLVLNIAFFVLLLICAIVMKKRLGEKIYADSAIILSVVCIALFFYNSSLRTDIAYIIYFILALPFIGMKNSDSYASAEAVDIEKN